MNVDQLKFIHQTKDDFVRRILKYHGPRNSICYHLVKEYAAKVSNIHSYDAVRYLKRCFV
jgi:hypothetical protein